MPARLLPCLRILELEPLRDLPRLFIRILHLSELTFRGGHVTMPEIHTQFKIRLRV